MTTTEATRARIADVAEQLFRSMGYQKTAVADIARELGMSPANIYRFYASKSAINETITARLLEGVSLKLEALAAGGGSAEARLHAITQELLASSTTLFFKEKRMHDMVSAAMGEHWGVITVYITRFVTLLAGVVQEGMAAGDFAPGDPLVAAQAIKACTMIWHHPAMLAECMQEMGRTPDEMSVELRQAMELLIAGLKRGVR
jgi:AcrR family transcriptional regulator